MTLASVGFDHTNTPLALLERVALSSLDKRDAMAAILESDHVTEVVVLSTCMRTEIYFEALRFHGGVEAVLDVMAKYSGLDRVTLEGHMTERYDAQVSQHLFRVASGLESAVLGEHEILGQVARAWEAARETQSARASMNDLFRHAVGAGKRARSETAISRGTTSIGQAAVAMAETQLGNLADRHVLVLGAGEMGEAMGVALSYGKQACDVTVCNRTPERADELAERIQARASSYENFADELAQADVLLTSTGAEHRALTHSSIEAMMAKREDRHLVIIDMGLPRDVDPRVTEVDGVTLLDLENLHLFTEAGRAERIDEIEAVEVIVEAEVESYTRDVGVRSIAPLITAMYERGNAVRTAELEKYKARLAGLNGEQREAVEALTNAIVAKLLHRPVSALKSSSGTSEGEYLVEAMRLLLNS